MASNTKYKPGRRKISDPHPVDILVGQRIRSRRTELGMTQEGLGRSLGITFQQLQKYERGINRVSASRLDEIGKALAVPIAYFFATGAPMDQFAADRATLEFAKLFQRVPAHHRTLLRHFMKVCEAAT